MIQLLKATDYVRTPWKNGLGWTEQIAIHPPQADLRRGDYKWRISTAHIANSAPFSIFENHDRLLVILEANEPAQAQAPIRLSHTFEPGDEPEVIELPLLEPYEFPGDIQTQCDLMGGPVQDLSVFFQKGQIQAQAQVQQLNPTDAPFIWEPQAKTSFMFVVKGSITATDVASSQQYTVNTRETLRIDADRQAPRIELTTQSDLVCLVLIEIQS